MLRIQRNVLIASILVALPAAVFAETGEPSGYGFRGSLGTDVNLGLGVGLGLNYLVPRDGAANALEVAADFFYANSTESSDNGFNTYDEETWLYVYGLRLNVLMGYAPYQECSYFIAGIGLGAVMVEWEETSATDISLGTLLPGGGSMQDATGSVGATILNVGAGRNFGGSLEGRIELPLLISFSEVGGASAVIPTATVSVGKRF